MSHMAEGRLPTKRPYRRRTNSGGAHGVTRPTQSAGRDARLYGTRDARRYDFLWGRCGNRPYQCSRRPFPRRCPSFKKTSRLKHSSCFLGLVWRTTRSGDFFKAFDGEIAVGVGDVVPDAGAIEESR
jgi:hypothetical protein